MALRSCAEDGDFKLPEGVLGPFIQNVVLKGALSKPYNFPRPWVAYRLWGTNAESDHASPTTIHIRKPARGSIRIFKDRIIAAGSRYMEIAEAALWNLCLYITRETGVAVVPMELECTNIHFTCYVPFTIDLFKLRDLLPTSNYEKSKFPAVKYAFALKSDGHEVSVSTFREGAVIISGCTMRYHGIEAMCIIYPYLERCKVKPLNQLEARNLKHMKALHASQEYSRRKGSRTNTGQTSITRGFFHEGSGVLHRMKKQSEKNNKRLKLTRD